MAAGVAPGPRYVFVTAALFDRLDAAQLRGVVAHEVGHHRHHHVTLRYGLLAGAVTPLLAVAEFAPGLVGPALALAVPYGLVALAVLRRTEWTADADAVARGSVRDWPTRSKRWPGGASSRPTRADSPVCWPSTRHWIAGSSALAGSDRPRAFVAGPVCLHRGQRLGPGDDLRRAGQRGGPARAGGGEPRTGVRPAVGRRT
ncbi:M48 family metalloprotease [Halomicroarcula sp. GCM10025709]|uniref:M48 family metalloprotease n=1 Tax=Halomicroarcula sp. GCM10025709 TaxID=3252669 RepID=UPI00360C399B